MPDPWMPGLNHDPGQGAGYPEGQCAMQFVVHHDTGGSNSYEICKWGRDGYDTGLCQILLPKVGVPWQFSEIDSVAYHCGSASDYDRDGDADNYNRTGPGLEVERLQGEALSSDQISWLHDIGQWLESEWGIPNVQYRGVPLTDADNFHGHVNHRDLHPNPDGLSPVEWDLITSNGDFLMALNDEEQREILRYVRQLRDGTPYTKPLLVSVKTIIDGIGPISGFGFDSVTKMLAGIRNKVGA